MFHTEAVYQKAWFWNVPRYLPLSRQDCSFSSALWISPSITFCQIKQYLLQTCLLCMRRCTKEGLLKSYLFHADGRSVMPRMRTCREKDRIGFKGLTFISFYKWTLQILFRPFHLSSHQGALAAATFHQSHRIGGTLRHLACRPRLICLCRVEIIISSGHQTYWSASGVPWAPVFSEHLGVQDDKINYTEVKWTLNGFCRTVMRAIKGSWATRG